MTVFQDIWSWNLGPDSIYAATQFCQSVLALTTPALDVLAFNLFC